MGLDGERMLLARGIVPGDVRAGVAKLARLWSYLAIGVSHPEEGSPRYAVGHLGMSWTQLEGGLVKLGRGAEGGWFGATPNRR